MQPSTNNESQCTLVEGTIGDITPPVSKRFNYHATQA